MILQNIDMFTVALIGALLFIVAWIVWALASLISSWLRK